MALTIIGGSNFLGRFLIRSLAAQYPEIRLADMYPYRQSVYKLQEDLPNTKIVKHALSYPTSLRLALTGASEVIVVTHDYFKLAFAKNFYLERAAFYAKELGIKKLRVVSPLELVQLNPWDGDPDKLVAEAEGKARVLVPELSILRTNLIFGQSCTSLLIQQALDSISSATSPFYPKDGISKFQPVHESDVLEAFLALKPGEEVTLSGPEVLSWAEIVKVLKAHATTGEIKLGGPLESLRRTIATCKHVGDLFYPSHIQQLYRLLSNDLLPPATKTGKTKLGEVYTPGTYKAGTELAWHRVILD